MKKPQVTTEKTTATTKTEQPAAPKANKTTPKKTATAQPAEKKAKTVAPQAQQEPVKASAVTETAPQKTASKSTAAKKNAASTPELTMAERVGLTAGSIWHYLSEHGETPVSKLVAALTEEEKIVQRSIGWLAQEDKITIASSDRVETVALKA